MTLKYCAHFWAVFRLSRCAFLRIAYSFCFETITNKLETGGVKLNMQVPVWILIVAIVAAIVVGVVVGIVVGYNRRKAIAEREIGSAEEEARRILNGSTVCRDFLISSLLNRIFPTATKIWSAGKVVRFSAAVHGDTTATTITAKVPKRSCKCSSATFPKAVICC